MLATARIAKHPIHPMLIVFPIGLWIFSFVMDLIYFFWSADQVWNTVALYTMIGGIAGALIAALPGFIDYMELPPRIKAIATWHMSINLILVALYVVNAALRVKGAPVLSTPMVLSLVGVIVVSIAGWLGGEMVYVFGAAVETPDDKIRGRR